MSDGELWGKGGGERKADPQLDNNKRPKPSCSTAMDVDTENPSPDHTVQTDCQRQGDSEAGKISFMTWHLPLTVMRTRDHRLPTGWQNCWNAVLEANCRTER